MSLTSSTDLPDSFFVTRIIACPTSARVDALPGKRKRKPGYIQPRYLYPDKVFFKPGVGFIKPGRKAYTFLKGSFIKSFSVLPFTRAHMLFPFSVLSVLAPDT